MKMNKIFQIECEFFFKVSPRFPTALCRMFLRTLLILQKEGERKAFNGRQFASLMSRKLYFTQYYFLQPKSNLI